MYEIYRKFLVMTMSIEPTCLEVIYQKREILTERIWKISAISTVSGVLPIGGSNLTADIDLLRKEIQTYRLQFGITDDVLRASSNCPGKNCNFKTANFKILRKKNLFFWVFWAKIECFGYIFDFDRIKLARSSVKRLTTWRFKPNRARNPH